MIRIASGDTTAVRVSTKVKAAGISLRFESLQYKCYDDDAVASTPLGVLDCDDA